MSDEIKQTTFTQGVFFCTVLLEYLTNEYESMLHSR